MNDIKFNAAKTNFMIFNEKTSNNTNERNYDNWKEELTLNGEVLKRSTLYFGAENFNFNQTTMKDIRKIEDNYIKSLVDMPTRCHTTYLMKAMEVLEPSLEVEKNKLGFYNRLLENEITRTIVEEELKLNY